MRTCKDVGDARLYVGVAEIDRVGKNRAALARRTRSTGSRGLPEIRLGPASEQPGDSTPDMHAVPKVHDRDALGAHGFIELDCLVFVDPRREGALDNRLSQRGKFMACRSRRVRAAVDKPAQATLVDRN